MFGDKINIEIEKNKLKYDPNFNEFLHFDINEINNSITEEKDVLNKEEINKIEKEDLKNLKSKMELIEKREEIIKVEFENEYFNFKNIERENLFSSDCKLVEIDLIPFIFIEEYKNNGNIINIPYNNHYSLIDKFTRCMFDEIDIKQINETIERIITHNINYCSVKSITFKLLDYGCLPATNYIFSCHVKINKKYFERERKDINIKEHNAYKKLLKYNIKEDIHDVHEFSDCFDCINEYLNFYLGNIFGYCEYLPKTIDSVTKDDDNFSKYTINPIDYMKNIILVKKFISKQKEENYLNLIKLGFIFNHSIEIKEEEN